MFVAKSTFDGSVKITEFGTDSKYNKIVFGPATHQACLQFIRSGKHRVVEGNKVIAAAFERFREKVGK